ncbi:hypothetical protein J4E91_001251 [Alternaria rosae]|nr:hypothetical protein J4E91_001251 [Alternaria rosae]
MDYFIKQYTGAEYPNVVYPDFGSTSQTIKDYRNSTFVVAPWQQSLVTSILSAGTFFGAIRAGDIADFIGRRFTIIMGCSIFIVGGILETASIGLGVMVAGRLIAGFGVGVISSIVILYMSEIAPKKKGKLDKAAAALGRVRGQPLDSEYIQDELDEILANHEYEMSVVPQGSYLGSWMACFKGKLSQPSSNARRTTIGIFMQAMQQLTGINFTFYFGPVFFQQLGSISDPFLISLVTTLVNVLSTPASFVMVEKIGRRPLLVFGAAGMVIMQFIVGAIRATAGRNTADHAANPNATRAMIAFICLNISVFATTWGPCAWIVIGEIFPLTIRSRGVGLSTASNWFWNCIIGIITPYLVADRDDSARMGSNVFFLWGSLCCVSFLFAYFFVPEIKGLTLEQVDKMLEESTPRTSRKWKPHSTFAGDMNLADKHIEIPLENLTTKHKTTTV